jgi:hypothetical protein
LHIETTSLADRTYKLIQELEGDFFEAQANIVELTEAPNSDSEELKSTDFIDTTKGKPRCIILLFEIMQLIVIFTCAFKLLEFIENLRCIILGTY